MDTKPIKVLRKIWSHSKIDGNVWIPSIVNIGSDHEKFIQGRSHSTQPLPTSIELDPAKDWYFTPAISTGSRRKEDYPAQKLLWVDCDDGHEHAVLLKLRPSILWETSPGHFQAIWLMKDPIPPQDFSKNGLMGLLADVTKADRSGVDIGQLLRIPGTNHHKKGEFAGKILVNSSRVFTKSHMLNAICRHLGFSAQMASEISAENPWGDRSKQLWKFETAAAHLGVDKDVLFKVISACGWNKWKDDPDRLREDINKAYSTVSKENISAETEEVTEGTEEPAPLSMKTLLDFSSFSNRPVSWVVPGIIPESGCGLLVAPPKAGKTRLTLEMLLGCSSGDSPLGISSRKKYNVGFFSLEDGEYLVSKRIGTTLDRDENRNKYHWSGYISSDLMWHPPTTLPLLTSFEQIDLSSSDDKQRLLTVIQDYNLKLVVIDTLSMAIGKADVSNSKDMYSILKDVKTIAKATKCAIMFIHHTRKRVLEKEESIQEMVLGSTALHAWCDFIMNVKPASDENPMRLSVQTKMGSDSFYLSDDLKRI